MKISGLYATLLMLIAFLWSEKTSALSSSFYASNSVLAQGKWYKVGVQKDGFYKLTYADLKKMGITNPAKVQIRGYGGRMLSEDFSKTYYDDLPQVALWINKGADGIFNDGDYLLFYGQGTLGWTRTATEFVHTNNPYSDTGYYFVGEGDSDATSIEKTEGGANSSNEVVVNTYNDFIIHEQDRVNLLESGRAFYGESFENTTSRDFSIHVPGIVSWNGYTYNFVMKPSSTTQLTFKLNGETLNTRTITANTSSYSAGTDIQQYVQGVSAVQESNTFTFSVSQSGVKNVHLNYFRLYFRRKLQPYGATTLFRNDISSVSHLYQIANPANGNLLVFDVTNPILPVWLESQKGDKMVSFRTDNDNTQKEYALVDLSQSIPSPIMVGAVSNQNLHASQSADMVIIVPSVFKAYAERLAKAHSENSGLTSLLVNPDEIYNEFSSGMPDATAYRRFMKMLYDRGTTDADRPKYLLLFGAGTYNNKFINSSLSDAEKRCYLLTYQSEASLSETSSFVTDDYFGFLQDEGALRLGDAKLNLGIGRLPVRSQADAEVVLGKILAYMNNQDYGIWQNNICFVADDAVAGSNNSPSVELSHIRQSNKYANIVETNHPQFIVNKVYLDAYKRVVQSNGNRYPDAQADMFAKLNAGQLILNFVGHGSPRDWAHEYILTLPDIQAMNNKRLPLWVTATCDFSRFDANGLSGGEAALINPKGGAIALLSTVRVVYISNNDVMSTHIYNNIFQRDGEKPLRFGDIIKNAKLSFTSADDNKLRFLLLGDPALRLAYPDSTYKAKITLVNGAAADGSTVNIPSLGEVNISGILVDADGEQLTDFDGNASVVVFDSQQDLTTRDNGGTGSHFAYTDYLNRLYSGVVPVSKGAFSVNFVVPKDIMYASKQGKVSILAWNADGKQAQGSFFNYTVNGTNPDAVEEKTAPQIVQLYLNTPQFVSGDKTNTTPMFYALVRDDTGINLSGGIGHNIELIVDGEKHYNLTSQFVLTGASTKEGYVNFSLPTLSEGYHTLKFVVWDVWNNATEHTIDFWVTDSYEAKLITFDVARNPVKSEARLLLSSNVPGSAVSVRYDVYTLSGRHLFTHTETGSTDLMNNHEYVWDLRAANGMRVHPGVYVCRATITIDGNYEHAKAVKLLVLAQ